MLSKEEVALIESYSEEEHVSLSSSLREFGISSRQYYRAKHKYLEEQDGKTSGEFIQLSPESAYVSNPIKRRRTVKSKPCCFRHDYRASYIRCELSIDPRRFLDVMTA